MLAAQNKYKLPNLISAQTISITQNRGNNKTTATHKMYLVHCNSSDAAWKNLQQRNNEKQLSIYKAHKYNNIFFALTNCKGISFMWHQFSYIHEFLRQFTGKSKTLITGDQSVKHEKNEVTKCHLCTIPEAHTCKINNINKYVNCKRCSNLPVRSRTWRIQCQCDKKRPKYQSDWTFSNLNKLKNTMTWWNKFITP